MSEEPRHFLKSLLFETHCCVTVLCRSRCIFLHTFLFSFLSPLMGLLIFTDILAKKSSVSGDQKIAKHWKKTCLFARQGGGKDAEEQLGRTKWCIFIDAFYKIHKNTQTYHHLTSVNITRNLSNCAVAQVVTPIVPVPLLASFVYFFFFGIACQTWLDVRPLLLCRPRGGAVRAVPVIPLPGLVHQLICRLISLSTQCSYVTITKDKQYLPLHTHSNNNWALAAHLRLIELSTFGCQEKERGTPFAVRPAMRSHCGVQGCSDKQRSLLVLAGFSARLRMDLGFFRAKFDLGCWSGWSWKKKNLPDLSERPCTGWTQIGAKLITFPIGRISVLPCAT